jgi:DNA polymerase-3 subunit epsilon
MMTEHVFLDTETTGLDDDAQVVEIAIVDSTGAVLFESLVKPTVPVDPEAAAIHGIGPDRLASAPAWPEIADRVRAVLEGKTVVIFNSDFDTRLLQQTATAHSEAMGLDAYDEAVKWILDLETVCAMYRAADVYGATNQYGTISLINAAAAAGVEFQGRAHSAAGDAATTAALWRVMNAFEHEN